VTHEDRYRRGLLAGLGMAGLGAVSLWGGAAVAGWLAVAFGGLGVVVSAAALIGWIAPREPDDPWARATGSALSAGYLAPGPKLPPGFDASAGPAPTLDPAGLARVAHIVATLHAAGVLAPSAPDPVLLQESVADHLDLQHEDDESGHPDDPDDPDDLDDPGADGVPVTAVLAAVLEASYYHPEFRCEDHSANLVLHSSHTEQLAETLEAQIADLVRLARGAIVVDVQGVDQEFAADGAPGDRTRIRLSVDGAAQVLDYAGASKHLSTVLHVRLARALRDAGAGLRLAWLWDDQGTWVTVLGGVGVDRLNADLGLDPDVDDVWEWIDEQEPVAA
jgi:hypothetical protein